jgi:hypothetical protein
MCKERFRSSILVSDTPNKRTLSLPATMRGVIYHYSPLFMVIPANQEYFNKVSSPIEIMYQNRKTEWSSTFSTTPFLFN